MADSSEGADCDVLICWSFASLPVELRSSFQRPCEVITLETPPNRAYKSQVHSLGWPHPIVHLLRRRIHRQPLRIGLLGFSESCTGVRELLSSSDAGLVDSVVVVDGAHAGFRDAKTRQMWPANIGPWVGFGGWSAFGVAPMSTQLPGMRQMVITHSSIPDQLAGPYPYASTTRVADEVVAKVLGALPIAQASRPAWLTKGRDWTAPSGCLPTSHGGACYPQVHYTTPPIKRYDAYGGLHVIGYDDLDPTGIGDHKYQAAIVMPMVLRHLLIERWNQLDPYDAKCVALARSA